jgi:hypothetical protein
MANYCRELIIIRNRPEIIAIIICFLVFGIVVFDCDKSTQKIIAISTFGVIIVALFGDWLKANICPPILRISLWNKHGVLIETPNNGQTWWYHVRVENANRQFSTAHQVQILLLEVAYDGVIKWSDEVPLGWRHSELQHPEMRKVGPPAMSDIFSITKCTDGRVLFDIATKIKTSATPPSVNNKCKITLTLQARSVEMDSKKLMINIDWDGNWFSDTYKMMECVHITDDTLD